MIDKATAQRIKDTADIVEVVSDYVHLTRRGVNYIGLCPFHNERTPSFSVNRARNFCYCFSCHKGGSPVNFIMQKEGISYHEAMLQLARKYGIKVEERKLTDAERVAQNKRESMFLANEWAMQLMEKNLHETEEGRDVGLQYFYQRGVTEDAIKQFHLGYALDSYSALSDAVKKSGYSIEILKELGLIGTGNQGRDYDRFRGRVIFPILNSSAKVIAFGGRDLKGGPAKYINSPESEIYKKSNELYGLYQARQSIVKDDKVFLVEGYMDVIGMWQAGMKNVVASSGTALTDGQINLLHRFTKNITLIYDGDAAGIKASLRGINMLLQHNMNVKVLLLPDGDDPDSFARKHTPEEFNEYLKQHETDIIRFKIDVLSQNVDMSDPIKRVSVVKSVVESVACIPDKITREIYIQECGALLNVPEEMIASEVKQAHYKILEAQKRERTKRSFEDPAPFGGGNDSVNNSVSQQQQNLSTAESNYQSEPVSPLNENSTSVVNKRTKPAELPLLPLERTLLKYCIKYGFMPFCESVDNNGNNSVMTFYEFVDEDMSSDSITFSVESFRKVFEELRGLLVEFREAEKINIKKIEETLNDIRREGYDRIASKSLSMQEIASEEKKLEIQIENKRLELVADFAKKFPTTILASHEDDDIRLTVTDLISERYRLSNIYIKNGQQPKEEEIIDQLIMRALTELKSEIIEQKYKELLNDFVNSIGKISKEEEQRMQMEINNILQMRSAVAKVIGERIIPPKRRN